MPCGNRVPSMPILINIFSPSEQVYHIKSNDNCLQILAVQVEPSSSSGIDIPLDSESPPR